MIIYKKGIKFCPVTCLQGF